MNDLHNFRKIYVIRKIIWQIYLFLKLLLEDITTHNIKCYKTLSKYMIENIFSRIFKCCIIHSVNLAKNRVIHWSRDWTVFSKYLRQFLSYYVCIADVWWIHFFWKWWVKKKVWYKYDNLCCLLKSSIFSWWRQNKHISK